MKTFSCIIPAYNEAARIVPVLDSVMKEKNICEVIVIDDGSTDATQTILKRYNQIRNIHLPINRGKSYAVAKGIAEARGEYLLLLDADLVGLTASNVSDLIGPVYKGTALVSISLRKNAPWLWKYIGLDYLSGERVIPRSMFMDNLNEISQLPAFGLEVFLNREIVKHQYSIAVVLWENVESPYKYKKYGLLEGIYKDAKMVKDIFKVVSLKEILGQMKCMLSLRI